MKPLIGITGRRDTSARLLRHGMHAVGETYTRAIHQMGGVPIILPPLTTPEDWPTLLERLDGLLLSGGEDIAPEHYRQADEPWLGSVDPERDASELGLVQQWLTTERPLLAICRGHQILNVARQGTLYQDIATYLPHALDHAYTPARMMEQAVHSVTLTSKSRLAEILGGVNFEVNSAHHQAVQQPGIGLVVTAYAPDGIIEALELSEHPFCVGVQWHPEAMLKVSETMSPLFAAFVSAAAR
ncbi:MAG TPA: gamma-glutamyl-gamma-aminobutyrate hydrolase family protein [Anaerolineae bacterium]|nr:gamma-glutamyl-gamma-aminobutyrate hydrolase family protein [Anaerolineae bacterium]